MYSQLLAGDIIIGGPGPTTENIMVDNNNDMKSPEGQTDRINQREGIRCGERTMFERLQRWTCGMSLSDLTEVKLERKKGSAGEEID